MTTTRKPMSGRAQHDGDKLDAYNKDSKSKSTGRFMRTFSRSKKSLLITAWNDPDFMLVLKNSWFWLADVSAAVDSETVGSPQALKILDLAWELFYENANLKDLSATEETAWKTYFCAMAMIIFETQIQYNMRCYLPAFTESDALSTGIQYFAQSSWDIFISSMAEFPVPKGIYELADIFVTWLVQIAQPYEQYTLRLPEAYICPFNGRYDLEDLEAARDLLRANWGNMLTHSKKFGLKLGKWRDPVKPKIKTLTDPDVIAFFNHANLCIYNNTPASMLIMPNGGFTGANLTTDYTSVEYMFKDNPNESVIHVLAQFFGTYNATNNPYGGLILEVSASTAEYNLNALRIAQHGTAVDAVNFSDDVSGRILMLLHKGVSDNFKEDGEFNIGFFGTKLTADKGLDDAWVLSSVNQLFYGTGRGATEANNDLINYIGRLLV